jgi:tripartite-type tricarboxylate transporter receptor subunit TctC
MVRINRRQALRGLVTLTAALRAWAANAQSNYPARPIRVIVPFAPGGVGETVMRVLAPAMEEKLGQKLVIESKPGGGGSLGTQEVARAAGDGYTLLAAPTSNLVVNQFLMKLSFDPLVALSLVTKIADVPLVVCSNPSVPARDLVQFVQYARAHRGELNFGSPGNGSINHLVIEMLKQRAGIELTHVPYRGASQAALAALANEIQLFPMGLAVVGGHLHDGKLTALAVTTNERLPMLSTVPTVIEQGFPSLAISNWWAIAAPKDTPQSIVGILSRTVTEALRTPSMVERFAALGISVPEQTRERFIAGLRSEAEQWSDVIRRGKIAID